MPFFSGVTFVSFCFVFVLMLSLKPRPFVQSFFDMQAPRYPQCHVFLFYVSLLFIYVVFSKYFLYIAVFSLYGEYVVSVSLPNGVFLPCDHGWILVPVYVMTIRCVQQWS